MGQISGTCKKDPVMFLREKRQIECAHTHVLFMQACLCMDLQEKYLVSNIIKIQVSLAEILKKNITDFY